MVGESFRRTRGTSRRRLLVLAGATVAIMSPGLLLLANRGAFPPRRDALPNRTAHAIDGAGIDVAATIGHTKKRKVAGNGQSTPDGGAASRQRQWAAILQRPDALCFRLKDATPTALIKQITQVSGVPMTFSPGMPVDRRLSWNRDFRSLAEVVTCLAKELGCAYTVGPDGVLFVPR